MRRKNDHPEALTTVEATRIDYHSGNIKAFSPHKVENPRRSDVSNDSVDLESLENILGNFHDHKDTRVIQTDQRKGSGTSHRAPFRHGLLRKRSTGASSDTDYFDGEPVIPSADVVLDNSKTLGYSGGAAKSEISLLESGKRVIKEKEAWLRFKNEILRLAHTLKLKGWRRIPLDGGAEITVQRLSGALTNAVYVVSPPEKLLLSNTDPTANSLPARSRKAAQPQ